MQNLNLEGTSILIVEDDTLLRKQIGDHLERLRMDVTAVGNIPDF